MIPLNGELSGTVRPYSRNEKSKKPRVIENRPQQLNGLNDSIKSRHFMLKAGGLSFVEKIKIVV